MNYFGVGLCALSALFYLFIKTETQPVNTAGESEPLLRGRASTGYEAINEEIPVIEFPNESEYYFDRLNPKIKRIFGTALATIAGLFLALAYIPYLYIIDRFDNASKNSLDYIFSMYSGILLSSFFYFAIYCLFKQNRPFVNVQSIFPAFLNGWLWGVANCSLLFSNTVLSQAVTFPIAGSVPSMIAALYGIFLFKEITGTKNFIILIFGFVFTINGAILCGLSK